MPILFGTLVSSFLFGIIVRGVASQHVGIETKGVRSAMVTGLLIGVTTQLVLYPAPQSSPLMGALIAFIVSLVVMGFSHRTLQTVRITDLTGLHIAALFIALIQFDLLFIRKHFGDLLYNSLVALCNGASYCL